MLIFSYRMVSIDYLLANEKIFRIDITDAEKDNTITWFRGKKYKHTLEPKEIKRIIKIIKGAPGLFDIKKKLEPNDFDDYGVIYYFVFSDGEHTNRFSGQNILDYGRLPRKNATLALRTAREIKEKVLEPNGIRTMISSRLQHWPKYRLESDLIPPCGNITLQKIQQNNK